MIDFRAFGPPTIDTFAAVWLGKARHCMRKACEEARFACEMAAEERSEYHVLAQDHVQRAWWFLGQADAACSVLYDVNHPRAYRTLRRYQAVRRAIERAVPVLTIPKKDNA